MPYKAESAKRWRLRDEHAVRDHVFLSVEADANHKPFVQGSTVEFKGSSKSDRNHRPIHQRFLIGSEFAITSGE